MTAPVDADVLTGQAELACSVASRLQQTEPVVFSEKLDVDAERREQLRSDMAESLAKGGFELHYQPLVATNGAALHKAEALLRWQHPRWGVVAPGVFIPVAE